MKKLTPRQIEQYHKGREKGFLRFVLIRGILMWGVPMGTGFGLYKIFVENDMTGWTIGLPIWVIAGILFGSAMWHAERTIYIRNMALKDKPLPE